MKKLKLTVLTAFMMSSMFIALSVNAQSPCCWTLNSQLTDPTCDKLCNGSIIVTPSIVLPDVVYAWSNGSSSSQLYNLCAGTYVVTVTDDKKCSQTYTFTLYDPAEVEVSCTTLNDETYCGAADGSIEATATGGDGNFTYEWQTTPVQMSAIATGLVAGSYTVIVYDGNDCTATTSCDITCEKKEDCDGFRTQTQGGWGQCQQNGNNPGTYLFANFAGAFPAGLTIGCNRTLKLTSAQAVCDFLPSGTSPKVLPVGNMVDPGGSYSNVFAGQLVAATLNVEFDEYDPDFGDASTNLGDLIIAVGPFTGWTVNELIEEANEKIGGCGSVYSNSALSSALDSVNKNYTDGTVDNGFLVCPEEKKDDRIEAVKVQDMAVSIYPNPVSGSSMVTIKVADDQNLQVEVYNVTGQKVLSLYNGGVKAQESTDLVIDGSLLDSGIYFIKVIAAEKVYTEKFVVKN